MKYRDYNQIIKDYEEMEKQALSAGNLSAAHNCRIIIDDLILLRSQGALGLFKGTKEKWVDNSGLTKATL